VLLDAADRSASSLAGAQDWKITDTPRRPEDADENDELSASGSDSRSSDTTSEANASRLGWEEAATPTVMSPRSVSGSGGESESFASGPQAPDGQDDACAASAPGDGENSTATGDSPNFGCVSATSGGVSDNGSSRPAVLGAEPPGVVETNVELGEVAAP